MRSRVDDDPAVLAEGLKDAALVIFENSSHMAFIEERGPYIQVVEAFLAGVEAGSGPGAMGDHHP